MPKQTYKIQGFHGGINSDADPRDIQEIESSVLVDINIDSIGKIKTLGRVVIDDSDTNNLVILPNRGLFIMNSDRQLDGTVLNETFIIVYDNPNNNFDIKQVVADSWSTNQITTFDSTLPVFYVGDGNLRIGDGEFDDAIKNKWFGYIEDERFDGLLADSGTIGWVEANQAIEAPIGGNCLISTPFAGSDSNGVNSSSSEYIGNVADASGNDVADVSSVNLRVGVQYNSYRGGNAAYYNSISQGNKTDNTDIYPLFGDFNIHIEGTSGTNAIQLTEATSLTITEEKNIIFGIWIREAKYVNFENIQFVVNETGISPNTSLTWEFSKEEFKSNCWNIVSCNLTNITEGDASGVGLDSWTLKINRTGTDCDVYFSGIIIADNPGLEGFQSGLYTFHHTYLYDDEKQESLPFLFTDTETDIDVNKLNVVGSPLLFNFDAYINPFNSAGTPAYNISKRITGSRLYYKLEENDNYYLIGELDFVDKGFRWFPEGNIVSYSFANVTGDGSPTGETWYKTSVIAKSISPNTANLIDTFRNINGFSGNTKSIDSKFKTAVVHGRRAYVGNIKQNGKTHSDRMLKSLVNKFDVFPDKISNIDVVINDGETIIKLEAFADRILQFKEKTMYIINVSENIDFLEDTYENKGCAFSYHVTKTDFGIAWFNLFGVYFYDGKNVSNLLEKKAMRLINEPDWEAFITDGEDGSSDDSITENAHISYIPKKRQLLIKNENTDVFIYDFVLRAWTKGVSKINILRGSNNAVETNMTNFAIDNNQDLIYITNDDCDIAKWNPASSTSTNFLYQTKDIDFGEPSVRKKIYKVHITYKTASSGNVASNVQVDYDVNGGTTFPYDFANGTNFASNELAFANGWQVAELKPDVSSEANSIKSFQLRFATDGTVPSGFEINDISIVYRMKSIR